MLAQFSLFAFFGSYDSHFFVFFSYLEFLILLHFFPHLTFLIPRENTSAILLLSFLRN